MESANELVDRRSFMEATKKLKNVEDAIFFTLSQDITEQVKVSRVKEKNLRESRKAQTEWFSLH